MKKKKMGFGIKNDNCIYVVECLLPLSQKEQKVFIEEMQCKWMGSKRCNMVI